MKKQNRKVLWIVVTIALALIAFNLIGKYPAEYFDNFGIICFIFLFVLSVWMLRTKKETPDWVAFLVFIISLLGLIVDGNIVFGVIK